MEHGTPSVASSSPFAGFAEAASALAGIVTPNIWRLPVAGVEIMSATRSGLAVSTLTPHWVPPRLRRAFVVTACAPELAYGSEFVSPHSMESSRTEGLVHGLDSR